MSCFGIQKMTEYKYKINFTLKAPGEQGYKQKQFKTEKSANNWLKKNEDQLYWHQLVEINPKSDKEKPLAGFFSEMLEHGIDTSSSQTKTIKIMKNNELHKAYVNEDNYIKKVGTLGDHFETGMECMGLVFIEDGIFGPPNPNFDPSKPETRNSNFKHFSSYDALTFIHSGQIIEFPEPKQKVLMLKDIEFARKDGFNLSFYPRGFTKQELLEYFLLNTKVTIWIPKDQIVK